jgi:tricorn protease
MSTCTAVIKGNCTRPHPVIITTTTRYLMQRAKHLFFTTDRSLSPSYSNIDNTWIYPNTTQLATAPLDPATTSLLSAKNDDIKIDTGAAAKPAAPDTAKKAKPVIPEQDVQAESLEQRVEVLPISCGQYRPAFGGGWKIAVYAFSQYRGRSGPACIEFFMISTPGWRRPVMNGINELLAF